MVRRIPNLKNVSQNAKTYPKMLKSIPNLPRIPKRIPKLILTPPRIPKRIPNHRFRIPKWKRIPNFGIRKIRCRELCVYAIGQNQIFGYENAQFGIFSLCVYAIGQKQFWDTQEVYSRGARPHGPGPQKTILYGTK